MITKIDDLPDGVIGFEATGKLHAEDYRDVLTPAIEAAVADGAKLRVLLVMAEFDGLSGGALWQDMKMGVSHLRAWDRLALVTDVEWMVHAVHLFGWLTPGEFKTYPSAERAAAVTWLAGPADADD